MSQASHDPQAGAAGPISTDAAAVFDELLGVGNHEKSSVAPVFGRDSTERPEMTTRIDFHETGCVEILSTAFAIGWLPFGRAAECPFVAAHLDGTILGVARADLIRDDLSAVRHSGGNGARAFLILFAPFVAAARVGDVKVMLISTGVPLPLLDNLLLETAPPQQVFIMGSPRSGTSQLGASLVSALGLPWTGEAHVAPRFAAAAQQLSGDVASRDDFVRCLARWNVRDVARDAARRAYFFMHASRSFVDKTPGLAMVQAAVFMAECFPFAKFIFLQRHPIANLLSRMARLGGVFEEHCMDWAATMQAWRQIHTLLPHYLLIHQEDMAAAPALVASQVSNYLGRPDIEDELAASLSTGSEERTGAGLGRVSLSQTGWTPEQVQAFRDICGAEMHANGYGVAI